MADNSRIEELRRRVQRDPASIAFAQLAEEYRRAGRYQEAIETCEQGLAHHPGYLSARVTLGRSFLETNELEAARVELEQVLRAAPENLAALRGMAEIHHRRGELPQALAHYRTALEFARNDPELQHLVEQIANELEPQPAVPPVADGMSFEDVKNAFLNLSVEEPPEDVPPAPVALAADAEPGVPAIDIDLTDSSADTSFQAVEGVPAPAGDEAVAIETAPAGVHVAALALPADSLGLADVSLASVGPEEVVLEPFADFPPVPPTETAPAVAVGDDDPGEKPDANPQVDALERWLETIIADRQRRA